VGNTLQNAVQSSPLIRREEPKRRMAKVQEPRRTFCENRIFLGAILRRTSEIAGLNRDETAATLHVNPSSISRWWSGSIEEPPQIWRYTAHPTLRVAFLVAQAEAHEGGDAIVVETVVRVRRQSGAASA
jgi:hypothetical protein